MKLIASESTGCRSRITKSRKLFFSSQMAYERRLDIISSRFCMRIQDSSIFYSLLLMRNFVRDVSAENFHQSAAIIREYLRISLAS
jgi:hypothetical protein